MWCRQRRRKKESDGSPRVDRAVAPLATARLGRFCDTVRLRIARRLRRNPGRGYSSYARSSSPVESSGELPVHDRPFRPDLQIPPVAGQQRIVAGTVPLPFRERRHGCLAGPITGMRDLFCAPLMGRRPGFLMAAHAGGLVADPLSGAAVPSGKNSRSLLVQIAVTPPAITRA